MKFLEKDLEEIIHTTDRKILSEKGLNLEGVVKRQLRIGNYGIADLVTAHREYDTEYMPSFNDEERNIFYDKYTRPKLVITVYELKKDNISLSALLQAVGYLRGVERWFEHRDVEYEIELKIVLIGRNIPKNGELSFIPSIFYNVNFYTYEIDINGLFFNKKNAYILTNEGF